ncbi:hypothetical protein ACVME8_006612 [Bradyrhizobium diazoefficiens]
MDIAQRSTRMPSLVRSHDHLITLGYAAFAVVILVAIYFASGGPSFAEADFSVAMVP